MLVQFANTQVLARVDPVIKNDFYTLGKPALIVGTQEGLSLEMWPLFVSKQQTEVQVHKSHVICIVQPVVNLIEPYLKWSGEKTIETPQSKTLVLPG